MKINKFVIALVLGLACFGLSSKKTLYPAKGENVNMIQNQLFKSYNSEVIDNQAYPTKDVFVADVILDKQHGYEIDNTGKTSINNILQSTIDELYSNGGGTIYLPAGQYSITSRIDVKPYVNIRGDYKDPDSCNGDYGTIILCNVPTTTQEVGERYNIFRMYGSTALIGLTFFYPMQYMDCPAEYAYTIEIPGGLSANLCTVYTLQDITLLNSYKGICASITPATSSSITHEQLHLSNVKGTCLRVGAHLTNSSEVGTIENITFSPRFWANAPEEFNKPHIRNIKDFTSNNSIGMIIGDLEWQEISNVLIEDFHTGIYCIDGTRNTSYHMAFIGQFYNLKILNASYGVYVEKLYENMGIDFCESIIHGKEYAILSNSPSNYGCLKFSYCDLNGEVCGKNIYINEEGFKEELLIPWNEGNYNKPTKLDLFNVKTQYNADNTGTSDCSNAIQNALDDAHANGGGIVYMPAGFYRMEQSVTVYENTQLRGCFNALSQCQLDNTLGTFILSYYGEDTQTCDTADALIEIKGDNAGVSGLRIAYPRCNAYGDIKTPETINHYRFAIRGRGLNNYVTNVYMPGVYNGVEMVNDNFILKKVLGCFYHLGFKLSGDNGLVSGCLSNGACTLKPGSQYISDFNEWTNRSATLWNNVYSLTRLNTTVVTASDCDNLFINHIFSFACRYLVSATNCNIISFNLGFDSQPANSGAMFDLKNNTNMVVYNVLRDNCSTDGTFFISDETSKISIYNVILLLPGNIGRFKGNIIENESFPMTQLPAGNPFALPRISREEINYTYIQYPPEEEEEPDNPEPPIQPDEPSKKNGCQGNITSISMTSSIIGAISLLIFASVSIERKKHIKGDGK